MTSETSYKALKFYIYYYFLIYFIVRNILIHIFILLSSSIIFQYIPTNCYYLIYIIIHIYLLLSSGIY